MNVPLVTELNIEKIHLEIMLSNIGYSSLWQCSAPRRSNKTEHFAGRCSWNLGSFFWKPMKSTGRVSLQSGVPLTTVGEFFTTYAGLKVG
jgi:hypothetical protein